MKRERQAMKKNTASTHCGRRSKAGMKRGRQAMKKNRVIDFPVTEDYDKSLEPKERLLPGIPDEVTLDLITPKLNWKTFHILSSTCSAWQRAIRGHLVYDARVRSHSAETLVLVSTWSDDGSGFALYSLREKTSYGLPPLGRADGRLTARPCIALDGRIYVLGGLKESTASRRKSRMLSTNEVYMLDLAGQRQWKQCASMRNTRSLFGCGAMDRKIYVFGGATSDIHNGRPSEGGTGHFNYVNGSEVYDPSLNAWSDIEHMPGGLRSQNVVTSMGEELLVYGGYQYKSIFDDYFENAHDLMAYRPATGEWRTLSKDIWLSLEFDPIKTVLEWCGFNWLFFWAKGKFYMMSLSSIYVSDSELDAWTLLCSFSLREIREGIIEDPEVIQVIPVDNELLAIVTWEFNGDPFLVQSKGFSSGEKEIVWEPAPISHYVTSLLCTVTL